MIAFYYFNQCMFLHINIFFQKDSIHFYLKFFQKIVHIFQIKVMLLNEKLEGIQAKMTQMVFEIRHFGYGDRPRMLGLYLVDLF